MSYGLPNHGDLDWDDDLDNSVEALHADVQTAKADALAAKNDAAYAKNIVNSVSDISNAVADAEEAADTATTKASLATGAASSAQSYASQAQDERVAAEAARDAAEAVGSTNDAIIAGRINTPASLTATALTASIAQLKQWARNPDLLIAGTVTRDSNGAATSAPVVWPDGSPGTYTADTLSTAFPGAVDGYHITYGSPATRTYTQPTVTRDATGAATAVPAIVVS